MLYEHGLRYLFRLRGGPVASMYRYTIFSRGPIRSIHWLLGIGHIHFNRPDGASWACLSCFIFSCRWCTWALGRRTSYRCSWGNAATKTTLINRYLFRHNKERNPTLLSFERQFHRLFLYMITLHVSKAYFKSYLSVIWQFASSFNNGVPWRAPWRVGLRTCRLDVVTWLQGASVGGILCMTDKIF